MSDYPGFIEVTAYGDKERKFLMERGGGFYWGTATVRDTLTEAQVKEYLDNQKSVVAFTATKPKCSYCGSTWLPDKRGKCSSCGAPS